MTKKSGYIHSSKARRKLKVIEAKVLKGAVLVGKEHKEKKCFKMNQVLILRAK